MSFLKMEFKKCRRSDGQADTGMHTRIALNCVLLCYHYYFACVKKNCRCFVLANLLLEYCAYLKTFNILFYSTLKKTAKLVFIILLLPFNVYCVLFLCCWWLQTWAHNNCNGASIQESRCPISFVCIHAFKN